ncbi:hypothetical protein DICVIV_07964 [Dictyocaulus viviparus]|uniref:Uncharacterized protein n=1 Tax=Dictyocaulus viviparus TaxID=29172 RepID=A0A0D8XMU9_DICVI|nr:hypothetical protein DICVIV_07964 [Dictyocaulus viviparus]
MNAGNNTDALCAPNPISFDYTPMYEVNYFVTSVIEYTHDAEDRIRGNVPNIYQFARSGSWFINGVKPQFVTYTSTNHMGMVTDNPSIKASTTTDRKAE